MVMHSRPRGDQPCHVAARLQSLFSALVSSSWPPFAAWRRKQRDQQLHFGSLTDQALADIGLKRAAMRAAEYGIMPPDQALAIASDRKAANDRRQVV